MAEIQINDNFSFGIKNAPSSIQLHKKALEGYYDNFENAVMLEKSISIFVDTNVLLRYYKISFKARKILFQFFKKNKHRIFISNQVQKEFTSNRENVIEKYFEEVTDKIPKDFESKIVNQLKNFRTQNTTILKDYPSIEQELAVIEERCLNIIDKFSSNSNKRKDENRDMLFKDPFLELITELPIIDNLTSTEINFLIKEFDTLSKGITPSNVTNFINKEKKVFPGIGDIKEKADKPYGDYIIFHEMLKYLGENKKNIAFLTYDSKKGDWIRKNRLPHIKYIECTFSLTNHYTYILDAEQVFEELLDINLKSLVNDDNNESNEIITLYTLQQFLDNFELYENFDSWKITNKLVRELYSNGYDYIEDLQKDLEISFPAALAYRKKNGNRLNKVGMCRTSFRILKDNPKNEYNLSLSSKELINYAQFKHLIVE